ncbi:unnamed protein product [Ostreobium quekettii]|uniref:Uncharacterized protein n=1 Tax=Ostreobium quekettii TaxID=121088 RepID=A0A8S1IVN4_9CHLO|nr:unnamed protein product [Ostreobium quekettii]|eukprot:evm.model.scf_1047.4 EVM.evm.TU.scf_1047.4   scf_1047:45571-48553(-)
MALSGRAPRLAAAISAPHAALLATAATARTANAVVAGASRGIGLALVQELLRRGAPRIFALCRSPQSASALQQVSLASGGRVATVALPDASRDEDVAKAASSVREALGGDRLGLLINTVGLLHDRGGLGGSRRMPETSLRRVDADFLARNLAVNAAAPLLLGKHFWEVLAGGDGHPPGVFASLSARVGSIGDNGIGGWYSYRMSKAAQNQAVRTMGIELGRRGVVCVALHPGTCATDLSAPFQRNVPEGKLFAPSAAAGMLLDVIESLTPQQNGAFLAYDGSTVPW